VKVILFRHGPAEDRDATRWPEDAQRPLSRWGERRTRLAAQGLCRFERGIESILTSPFQRADHTARILSRTLGVESPETVEALAPGGSPRKVIEAVNGKPRAGTVVLVGHEPDLGALAALLVAGGAAMPLKKAGACGIEFDGAARAGAGVLEWLAPPRLLCRVSRRKATA
jgi:phosphohistidine phosphatase